jgi:carboxyl-terminal processing protease
MHGALVAVALSSSVLAYNYVAKASPEVTPGSSTLAQRVGQALAGQEFAFADLEVLTRTMDYVSEKYVEPERLDPPAMFDAGLEAVEKMVPEVLFRHEPGGDLLHIAVGSYTTAIKLEDIGNIEDMTAELRRVAAILEPQLASSEVDLAQVEYALTNGVLSTLDPHSVLMPPEASKEMEVENRGEFGGLGITITVREGRLTVEYPLEDTPAYEAGLKPDDIILRIDGESTINMDLNEAVSKLRGRVNDPVTITVSRDTWDEDRDIVIVRDRIKINPVEGELLDGAIGYIRIKNFHANVASDLDGLLSDFKRENGGKINGLVLDLRQNPGGFLNQAVAVSDKFLSSGPIVATVEAGMRNREEMRATSPNTEPDYPMVVLTDANSASASEIVAGALKAQGRAVVVGERTFGKGSVQHLYPFPDESRLKLTVAKYLTPGDRSIQSVGIPADILLEPSIVEERTDKEAGTTEPFVSLFWRTRVSREVDLNGHLDAMDEMGDGPAYSVRYLRETDEDKPRGAHSDPMDDWEVVFARDLLMAAPGTRRAEVLAGAGPVVNRYIQSEAQHIEVAFDEQGVDWAAGPQPDDADLSVSLRLGDDGVIRAGEDGEEVVQLEITNRSDAPVYQVMAISESSIEWLDQQEFFFGRIEPGETLSWPRRVRLPEGYRDEVGEVAFKVRDLGGEVLAEKRQLVRTVGHPLPQFQYELSVVDAGVAGTTGDGDGVAEPGEVVALQLTITNVGDGPSAETFAKLKNRSGRDLDLQIGTLEFGAIAAGESNTEDFLFEVRGEEGPLLADLTIGDNSTYDYAGVIRGGFYEFFAQTEELEIPVGAAMEGVHRTPPAVELSRAPGLLVDGSRAVLSGAVRDDDGMRDVIIYHGDEKIYYQGGQIGVTAMPFTAEATLNPGQNLFVVLARDEQGMTSLRSVVVWYDDTGSERLAAADLPIEGDQR